MPDLHNEDDLAEELARVRAGGESRRIVDVLREDAPLHRGRSTAATGRIRGFVLACFAELGLPADAVPFVLEELQLGTEPYPVAGAARALRGQSPSAEFADHLATAFTNMQTRDEPVSFDSLRPTWPAVKETSALREIVYTAAWLEESRPARWEEVLRGTPATIDPTVLGILKQLARRPPRTSCCDPQASAEEPETETDSRSLAALDSIIVEDHDGVQHTLGALTTGQPTVLTFFYTRCENPNKCAATIRRLDLLQDWLVEQGRENAVRILALTYDPEYDSPPRLRRYAHDLGLHPARQTTLGRLPGGMDELRAHLALRTGRGGSTVNRHAVEVFVLDAEGVVSGEWARQGWHPEEVGSAALASEVGRATITEAVPAG